MKHIFLVMFSPLLLVADWEFVNTIEDGGKYDLEKSFILSETDVVTAGFKYKTENFDYILVYGYSINPLVDDTYSVGINYHF